METPPSSSSGYLQHIPPSFRSSAGGKSPSSWSHHLQLFSAALQSRPPRPGPGRPRRSCDRHPEMFGLGATSSPAHRLQLFRLLYLLFITIHCVPAFISKGDCSCGALCTRCAPGLTKLAVYGRGRRTVVPELTEQRNLFPYPHVLTRENETTSVLPRGARKLSWSRCFSGDSISRSILSLALAAWIRSVGRGGVVIVLSSRLNQGAIEPSGNRRGISRARRRTCKTIMVISPAAPSRS